MAHKTKMTIELKNKLPLFDLSDFMTTDILRIKDRAEMTKHMYEILLDEIPYIMRNLLKEAIRERLEYKTDEEWQYLSITLNV